VEVVPAKSATGIFPFWKAEEQTGLSPVTDRPFLERADGPESPGFRQELEDAFLDDAAANELIGFLKLRKSHGKQSPHRHHLLIEFVEEPVSRGEYKQVILHTFWGGKVNRPFALALSAAWEEREHRPLQFISDDDAILLLLPHEAVSQDILGLLSSGNVEAIFAENWSRPDFRRRFRENAERALLLPNPASSAGCRSG
jgi:ATP-dependent Lhr-like helicase